MITQNDLYIVSTGSRSGSVKFYQQENVQNDKLNNIVKVMNQAVQDYIDAGLKLENLSAYIVKDKRGDRKLQQIIKKINKE